MDLEFYDKVKKKQDKPESRGTFPLHYEVRYYLYIMDPLILRTVLNAHAVLVKDFVLHLEA